MPITKAENAMHQCLQCSDTDGLAAEGHLVLKSLFNQFPYVVPEYVDEKDPRQIIIKLK